MSLCFFVPSPCKLIKVLHWPTLDTSLHFTSLQRPLIGHSTRRQHWVHQHNNICVAALPFDPWCTLNLLSSHDHFSGLSLVTAPGVKIGCINTTIFVLENSILTLGALLPFTLAKTSHIITSQASHCVGATIRNGPEILCLPYAVFFLRYLSIQLKFF